MRKPVTKLSRGVLGETISALAGLDASPCLIESQPAPGRSFRDAGRVIERVAAARASSSPHGPVVRGSRAMTRKPPALLELLDTIVADERAAAKIVLAHPELAHARVETERFYEGVHQLYEGDTALHLAAAALEPDVVAALLRAGADPNALNRRDASALHYACDPRPLGLTWNPPAQRRVLEQLLDAGARIDQVEKAGAQPLHRAVRARSPEAVRCLLERGADPRARHAKQGSTPLQLAHHSTGAGGTKGARAEQEAIVALLLEHGAGPHGKSSGSEVSS